MFAIAFDMANLFAAIYALKKIAWFKASVRDIRAFKVENWSDFTQIVKEDDWLVMVMVVGTDSES